ncbi:uncharacterized protein LOC123534078 [Mercenaria mercenaria]|uniref:uncharacterized protein LOC123534078 n=1 Tax=Mercenaria mercenaria TaxID=6596 RepID=UPI00234EDC0E|nr:uncharacterized protein LOC123534078 [Mercenaria mercenaria]
MHHNVNTSEFHIIFQIHKKLNLSPGKYTLKRRQFMDIESSTRKEKSKSKESKRRRLQLKQLRSGQYQEIREGKSYETEIDLAPDEADIECIPYPIIEPQS